MLKDKIKKNPIQVSPPNLKIKVMREKKKKLVGIKSKSGKLHALSRREDLLDDSKNIKGHLFLPL
jgi:hypothetical protein